MDKKLKVAFIGGDMRMVKAAQVLAESYFDVRVWGIDNKYFSKDICQESCEEAVNGIDVLVLPTPPSEDEVRVSCPLFSEESGIKIHKLLEMLPKNTAIMGGRMSPRLREIITKKGFNAYDYFNREELLIKNAVPTTEGAIGIAIDKMPKTIYNSKIAVVGYGRIGEALALKLNLLGAKVTVFVRKLSGVAKAQSQGLNGRRIEFINKESSLCELASGYDLIYNTVPYWIITEEIIKNIPKSTMVVDLASAPGGIDMIAAKKYDLNVIRALALPGKTAPETAGEIIAESIMNIIKEELII